MEAPGVLDKINALFARIDVSGDGQLEPDELTDVIGFYQEGYFNEDEVPSSPSLIHRRRRVPAPRLTPTPDFDAASRQRFLVRHHRA